MTLQPFKPRPTPKKSLSWILYLSFFLIGSLLIGGFYFLFYSDFFRIKEISFEGGRLIADKEISAAAIQVLANENGFWGKILGTDHFFFWHQPSSDRIYNQLPLLASLKITKDWQSKKISITIQEREVSGVWCISDGGSCFLFDRNGFAFASAPETKGSLILKVSDQSRNQIIVGQRIFSGESEQSEFFRVLEIIRDSGLAIDYVAIKAAADKEWAVKLAVGPELKLSRIEPMADSLISLMEKIKALPLDQIGYIDLTVPNRLYYR